MRPRMSPVTCSLILMLEACSQRDPFADNANNTGNLVAVVDQANATANAARAHAGKPPSSPPRVSPAAASPTGAPPRAVASNGPIPAALQGRWGLTPVDCTSRLGDAKGLLIVGADELRFYESRAVPSPGLQTDNVSLGGNFDFTGEGQTWSKYEALKRNGDMLTRTETNPAASYTYAKC